MPLARLDRTRRAYFGDAPEVDPLIVERQIIAEAVLTGNSVFDKPKPRGQANIHRKRRPQNPSTKG
jgi:hypothetical protein